MRRILIFTILLSALLMWKSAHAQILVEIFRNINCGNCRTPDDSYAAFLAAHPDYQTQVVNIHNSITDAQDPFYLSTGSDAEYRSTTVYKVASDPDAFISGISGGGNSVSQWEQLTTSAQTISYPVSMTATASLNSLGQIVVDMQLSGSSAGKQVKPYAMLVESGIVYDNTLLYGSEPNNIWDNIFRAMIPGKDGGTALVVSGATSLEFIYDTTGRNWNIKNCKIIAFLQAVTPRSDNVSHDILGLAVASSITAAMQSAKNNAGNFLGSPIPNPSQTFAKIPFNISGPANVHIVVCDDLGREVETIYNGFVEGSSFATFMPKNLIHGIYYARMYASGEYVGMQKVVFAP